MRLRDLREDGDYTQSHLAQLLNIRQNTYSQYENGQRQLPIDDRLENFWAEHETNVKFFVFTGQVRVFRGMI